MADSSFTPDAAFLQNQAEILTREIDTNEYIPEVRQIKTDSKSIVGAINYLHGQLLSAILNANSAQRVANDTKSTIDVFLANPPQNGKSAFEIANEHRPEGSKYKSEQEWVDSFEKMRADTLKEILDNMRIHLDVKQLVVNIDPEEWHHCEDVRGGYTCVIQDASIRKNQDVELVDCLTDSSDLFDSLVAATCASIADGEMTLRIPEDCKPEFNAELTFNLKEYILEGETE